MTRYASLWIFLVTLALRLLVVGMTQLDGLYGQDAFAYFNCAADILHTPAGQTPCSEFLWPWGYPALAALFMLLTQATAFGAQLSSVVTGAAVAPLAYWLVTEATPGQSNARKMAIAAGLMVAICGELLLSSIEVMSDAAGLFWASLSACLVLRWSRTPSRQPLWLVLAAVALAMAIITRWIYGGLCVPFALFVLSALRGQKPTVSILSVAAAAVAFCAILVPQLYLNAHTAAPVLKHGWVVNWNPASAVRRSFDNPDGHFDYRWPPLLYYAEPFVHPAFLFPLLTPAVFVGAWHLRRNRALILLGGWIAVLYLYLVGVPYENSRFGLAFFTPIAVLAGMGVYRISGPDWLRPKLLLALSLFLSVPFTWRALEKFESTVAQQTDAIRYVKTRLPSRSTVVTFELSISLQHYSDFEIVDLFAQSPQSLRPLVCGGAPAYLYVEPGKLESQWAGKAPATNARWLKDSIGLQQMGSQSDWVLYRLRSCDL